MVLVGETVMCKLDKDALSKVPKSHPRFTEGIYLEIRYRKGWHSAGSGHKIIHAKTVNRRADPETWKFQKLESLALGP